MPSLFVIRGGDQGMRFELAERTSAIGRDPANTIQLHDREVSRQHAELRPEGERLVLFDLKSSNGTFVNGQRVDRHELSSGDQVQVGGTIMLYTGAEVEADRGLVEQVDILAEQTTDNRSRIVRSISQDEGSRILDPRPDAVDSPWLARARGNLQVMYRTALAVSHTLDIDQLLARIMQLIFEWVAADRGCIMLLNPESQRLEPAVRRDRQGVAVADKLTISQTILDYVMQHKEGVLTSDAREDARWNPAASIVQSGIREAMCVPMQGRYDLVGVIYIDTLTPPEKWFQQGGSNKFTDEHLKLMIAIAHQAALAVEDTRYYSAMVQSERLAAVGQTIAMLSHHIKNILQGIRGGSYLIEMGLAEHDEEVVRKGWGIVDKNQNRISALVLDMLTFSKEREPEMLADDLNRVVGEVVELMRQRAVERQVELDWRPDTRLPCLTFDPEGMHRAVLNVMTNAIDACEQQTPGRVEVATEYDEAKGTARVVVADNGVGIAEEDRDKIFSIFVSRKGGRGTGLGLAVSNKILREHGGGIALESQVDQGSRFTLEIPAILPAVHQTQPAIP